jgi:hypothetical protein
MELLQALTETQVQDEMGQTAVTGVVSVASDSDEAETQFEVCCTLMLL